MSPVWLFYMTSTWVTPSSLGIKISEEITSRKSHIQYYPLLTLVVQHTGSNQSKQKLPQILPFTKLLK